MTGLTFASTRHIPEDELHAYLDQALSRSQCVEIECHLAECRRCRAERDRVAAVRDQTTALLADFGPRRSATPPPFEELKARHAARVERATVFRRYRHVGIWAASLSLAVFSGWWARSTMGVRAPAAALQVAAAPAMHEGRQLTAISPVVALPVESSVEETITPPTPRIEAPQAVSHDASEPTMRLASLEAPTAPFVTSIAGGLEDAVSILDGLWQSVDLDEARSALGASVPRIEGLPILDIQLQRGGKGERPLVVVEQQHPSGGVVRTIEGPYLRVADLLERQVARDPAHTAASQPARTPPDYVEDPNGISRRGNRVLAVTGHLPADSLNALARSIEVR